MEITVNGAAHTANSTVLTDLLGQLGVADKRIAVELNEEICPRSQWPNTRLCAGDRIEIVHAIGGG